MQMILTFHYKNKNQFEMLLNILKICKKQQEQLLICKKTKLLPINTDQISYIKQSLTNITTLKQHQYIEILGINFSENIKYTIIINQQQTLAKLENHIWSIATRQLSLYGKAILINTLILAKTTFLSNIFPIPQKILNKIHKTYLTICLWHNKAQEPIATKTLFCKNTKEDYI